MNGTIKSIKEIVHNLSTSKLDPETEVVIAPPSLYLLLAREHLAPNIEVAAQNVFDKPSGAFTGEISVLQLKDSNITWTLLGHSERRTILREEDDFVAVKTKAALDGGIGVILCCGESLEEREKGVTVEVVTKQLEAVNKAIGKDGWKNVVIAYEPIWAIGTGKVATTGASPRHTQSWSRCCKFANSVSVIQSKHKKSTPQSGNGWPTLFRPRQPRTQESSMVAACPRRTAENWLNNLTWMDSLSVVPA